MNKQRKETVEMSRTIVVIPCYKVAAHIEQVLNTLPGVVDEVILVDDCSPDDTGKVLERLAQQDSRVTVIRNSQNMGVGGAMIAGFQEALRRDCDIVIKLDGDGQMDSSRIVEMVQALENGDYDFVKGNRFYDKFALRKMPLIRKIGNFGMSFLVKVSSGYWQISDPTNGFIAINKETLQRIDMKWLSHRFFFESSLICELYYTGAKIKEISMPAIYGEEKSNLSVLKSLLTFPPKLALRWLRRLWLSYYVYDFNIGSLYFASGSLLFLFGLIFGIVRWVHFASIGVPAPLGTIMIAVLTFICGFQLLLAAFQYDLTSQNTFQKSK